MSGQLEYRIAGYIELDRLPDDQKADVLALSKADRKSLRSFGPRSQQAIREAAGTPLATVVAGVQARNPKATTDLRFFHQRDEVTVAFQRNRNARVVITGFTCRGEVGPTGVPVDVDEMVDYVIDRIGSE